MKQKPDKKFFYLAAGLIILTTLWGYWLGQNPQLAEQSVQNSFSGFDFVQNLSVFGIFVFIFLNNTVKIFIMMLAGTIFGLAPLYFIYSNGVILGLVSAFITQRLGFSIVLAGILPHGIFELTAMGIAGAYSFWLGYKFYRRLRFKESFLPALQSGLRNFARIILPLLLLAAAIEAFVTPFIIDFALRSI